MIEALIAAGLTGAFVAFALDWLFFKLSKPTSPDTALGGTLMAIVIGALVAFGVFVKMLGM